MGTKFATSYANLYMAGWECQFVYGSHSWEHDKILAYRRYIDDTFFIWRGGEEDLKLLLDNLDNLEWGITLDKKWDTEKVTFLDLDIYREENIIKSKTYFKEGDTNTFIDMSSCHNPTWLRGVPKGQFTRLRRNCTDVEMFKLQADSLKKEFVEKGYNDKDF